MNPGTRVCIYRAAYYKQAGRIVSEPRPGTFAVRLEASRDCVEVSRGDLEAIPEARPLDLKPHLKG